MSEGWKPPAKIEELFEKPELAPIAKGMNMPTAGPRSQEPVPMGNAPFQLYSLATPNGQKIGILLEELEIEYDAHTFNIGKGMQFQKGFVDINPNSKIPCGVDHKPVDGGKPVRLFESASMMVYLAEKHNKFLPSSSQPGKRAECMNWVFWQMAGQGPMTGNLNHFYGAAPPDAKAARDYGVVRYGMEAMRLMDVLNIHLSDGRKYICGEDYTIADMACFPWVQTRRTGPQNDFLTMSRWPHLVAWCDRLLERPQVKRGVIVCAGKGKPWLEDEKFKHLAKL